MGIFICPHCGKPLVKSDHSYLCGNHHCFDIAREGYVNLLPVQSKKTRNPGDNEKMISARRSFLETDLYRPLAEEIVSIISSTLGDREYSEILDLGCGEGYYAGIVSSNIAENIHLSALDISKIAVRYASKRYHTVSFCVASAFRIPVADNSIDLLYRIYAPSDNRELARVIKQGGYLLTVTPGERHLIELREMIYDKVLSLSAKSGESESFNKTAAKKLTYTMTIDEKNTIRNLLDMTPFGWKIRPESYQDLMAQEDWKITCDFTISLYRRN